MKNHLKKISLIFENFWQQRSFREKHFSLEIERKRLNKKICWNHEETKRVEREPLRSEN
jgi:hypothetical protein